MAAFERIAALVLGSLTQALTEEERAELEGWLAVSLVHRRWYAQIHDEEHLRQLFLSFRGDQAGASKARVLERIKTALDSEREVTTMTPVHRLRFLKTAWFKYAAAIILIVSGVVAYYSFFSTSRFDHRVVQHVPPRSDTDVPPGYNRAMLILSDGRQVELDSAASETIKDGNLSIENNDGQLIYSHGGVAAMNTMTTPKGGQYQLTLADGTKVWLNAASSITYPTVFKGKTRVVTITGEAYFEVAKNPSKPFAVKTKLGYITVLGTSFNVNAYPDVSVSKISLVEGSIKIGNDILQPGEAYVNGKVIQTNVEQDVAWKHGYFSFQSDDVKTVMQQLSRWYDIEVEYTGTIPAGRFTGKIQRNLPLSEVMELLAEARVQYKIEDRKVKVLP